MSLPAWGERGWGDAFAARLGCADGAVPDGALLTICDTTHCSGSFLLSYFLARHLASRHKPCKGGPENGPQGSGVSTGGPAARGSEQECRGLVCLLATAQTKAHYLSVARKMGVSTTQLEQAGLLAVIEGLPLAKAQGGHEDTPSAEGASGLHSLKHLYQRIAQTVQQQQRETQGAAGLGEGHQGGKVPGARTEGPQGSGDEADSQCWHRPCIIVDDAWFLEAAAAGATTGGAIDFLHYCRTLGGGKHKCSVVALVHTDDVANDVEPMSAGSRGGSMPENPVLASLLTSSDVTVHVRPLPSGHAVELHGEIDVVHRTGRLLKQADTEGWTHLGLQFNISDKRVTFTA